MKTKKITLIFTSIKINKINNKKNNKKNINNNY